ncbi:YheC/YheD family protein [Neobacillus sp. Marseille-QA0830]
MSQSGRIRFTCREDVGLSEMVIPDYLRQKFGIKGNEFIFHYGGWSKDVTVTFSIDVKENTILIHPNFSGPYTLPAELDFSLKVEKNHLFVGPIIAFIFRKKEKSISKRLKSYLDYTREYRKFGGLLIFCAANSIDIEKEMIEGHYFVPDETGTSGSWRNGVFPFPEVVFRRCRGEQLEVLSEQLPGRLFNHPLLDKWELYERLTWYPDVNKYFPETIKFTGMDSISDLLEKYHCVYAKPSLGKQADGIYRIMKERDQYIIEDVTGKKEVIEELESVSKWLKEQQESYILQQPVEHHFLNRNIVFRIILQKGYEKVWLCSGSYVRVGKLGKIATNRHLTESFMTTTEALRKLFQMRKEETSRKKQEMIQYCKEVCQTLEKDGVHLADVAFDAMLDESLNIKMLEINHLTHNHRGPLQTIHNREMYERIVSNPLQYAAALAGYGRQNITRKP